MFKQSLVADESDLQYCNNCLMKLGVHCLSIPDIKKEDSFIYWQIINLSHMLSAVFHTLAGLLDKPDNCHI